ncbi:hypothetical protein N2152v2_000867 [Parachlorella kessleri]
MVLRLARLLALGLLLPSVALSCTYTIKSGDTLYAISLTCGTTVDNLKTLNPGIVPEALYVGQVINVPCTCPQPSPSPAPPSGTGVEKYINRALWNQMFQHTSDPRCPSNGFYTYDAFVAAAKAFPKFATASTDPAVNKRELAAFLAQISHETTGGPSTNNLYDWGLCFKEELKPPNNYCVPSTAWPCAAGKSYKGRGPIQLSYNYNYGPAGKALGVDLLAKPELVSSNSVLSFKTALWFWMTARSPIPSCHSVMAGLYKLTADDIAKGRKLGYGLTTNIINGKIECGIPTPPAVADRAEYFKRYAKILGTTTRCSAQQTQRAARQGRPCVFVRAQLAPPVGAEQAQTATEALRACRVITAIKTPYLPNGKFDLDAYDQVVEHQIQNGVEGLIIGGTTGEGHLMSWDEHIMLIAHTVNQFGRKLKVIGNTGSNSTSEALHATGQGFGVGMHAALQINPYYGKTSKPGLLAHFKAVLDEGPAIVYNVPGRTSQDIPDDVILQIAQHPNFLGVKECTGNSRIESYARQGVLCWSGNDDEAHAGRHQHGGQGVISVTSNLLPGVFVDLMARRDDATAAQLQELIKWLFSEPNPIPLNTALMMCGLVKPVFRLPYVPLTKEERQRGARLLEAVAEHLPGRGAKLLEAVAEHLPGVKDIRVLEDSDFKLVARW